MRSTAGQRLLLEGLLTICKREGPGQLSITQTVVLVDGHPVISEPKTAKGRRSISLDPATVVGLRTQLRQQSDERLACGPAYQDLGSVVHAEDGSGVHPEAFADRFGVIAKADKLARIRLHDLRHSYAVASLMAGIHPKVVSKRLGHAITAITLDTYSQVLPSMDEQAASTVAASIFGV